MSDIVSLIIGLSTYLILGFYMYSLGECAQNGVTLRIKKVRLMDPNIIVSILLFSLICGLRYHTGTDCEHYVNQFEHIVKTGINANEYDEPLFTAFTWLVVKVHGGRILYLALIACAQLTLFYSAFITRKYLYPFLGIVLILGPHFLNFNNGLRQMLVACMFVVAVQQLIDHKRVLLFLLMILLGATIHSSAFILLLAVPLIWYDGFVNSRIAVAGVVISILIANLGVLDPLLANADGIMYLMGYDSYAERMDYYVGMEAQITHYGPRRIFQIVSYFLIIFYSERMKDFYKKDRLFRVSYLLFLLYICLFEMLSLKNLLFTRPLLYLTPFWLIISAYLLCYLKKTGKTFGFWISLIMLCSYSVLASIAEFQDPGASSLYRYIFFQDL